MKKLILILLFLPLFCSSQVLFDKPMSKCYVNEETNVFSCFNTLEGSKIYIENNFLIIDIVTNVYKYEIINKENISDFTRLYLKDENDKLIFSYDSDLSSENQWLTLESEKNKKERISYSKIY